MSLTKLEFRKIFTPLTIIALIVMLLVNLYAIFAHQGFFYINAAGDMTLSATKARIGKVSGAIDDEWIAARNAELQALLDDPRFLKTDDELTQLADELAAEGLSDAAIQDSLAMPENCLNSEGLSKYSFIKPHLDAAQFYENAEAERDKLLDKYSYDADIYADIRSRYDRLAKDYTAHYNYDLAYDNLQYAVADAFPFTVGIPVLVGLAPLFARERSRKTDSLILASKRGRRQTATAKISAGAAYSVLVWLIMTASAAVYVFLFFGTQGFEALWQFSSGSINSPFPWTIGQAVMVELATCLIGTLFFAFIVMLLSELTKSTFASVILGAALLLTPMIIDIDAGIALYLPTYVMRGVAIWSAYFPAKLFGLVTATQYLVIAAACIISAVCCTVAVRSFARRQAA